MDPEVASGSNLVYDRDGDIEHFIIWVEFPVSLDIDFSGSQIRLFVPGEDEWSIDDPSFPYQHGWTKNGTRLEISSRELDISEREIHSFKVVISLPLRTQEGDWLWEDSHRSEIELTFGNPDEYDLGFGLFEIMFLFILPFSLLVVILVFIEVVLRLTVKAPKKEKVRSTTETLLKLIDRTERMLRLRVFFTMFIALFLILLYVLFVVVAIINMMSAMVMTFVVLFFLSPWAILFVTSLLYVFFRREDLAWRKRLNYLREQQRRFMKGLEKE